MPSAGFCEYEVCPDCWNTSMNPLYSELGDVCDHCGVRKPENGWPTYVGRVCRWFASSLPGVRAYVETPDGERLYTRHQVARAAGLVTGTHEPGCRSEKPSGPCDCRLTPAPRFPAGRIPPECPGACSCTAVCGQAVIDGRLATATAEYWKEPS